MAQAKKYFAWHILVTDGTQRLYSLLTKPMPGAKAQAKVRELRELYPGTKVLISRHGQA